MRSDNSTWQILAMCVSLLDLEPGPILRHCARSSLCVLRLPLPGGCGRLAALRPAVGAQTHLRVWHSHSLARRHRQPTRGRVAGCVLCSLVPPHIDASSTMTKLLLCAPTGAMYPTSMRINEEGRLVVNFKTEARFRGQFVMSHPGIANTPTHTRLHSWKLLNVVIPRSRLLAIRLLCSTYSLFIYSWRSTSGVPSCVKVPKVMSANVTLTPQCLQLVKKWNNVEGQSINMYVFSYLFIYFKRRC